MAVNYTARTITIFLNVVGSYFWRLNSFLVQKNYTALKNSTSMLHVVPGNAKNYFLTCPEPGASMFKAGNEHVHRTR